MIVPARVLFGINLKKGVSKKAIIPKLETLQYTIPSNTRTPGEKDIDRNNIMCETILVDVTAIGGIMSMIYDLHRGIARVIPLHIELLPIPKQITRRNLLQ